MSEDLEPPWFDFKLEPSERREPVGRRSLARDAEELLGPLEEELAEAEGEEEGEAVEPDRARRRRGLHLGGSETTRRVLWAVPWAAFAIFIVAEGDLVFTVSMIGLGVIGLREFFRMAKGSRPFVLPAFGVLVAMVLVAHYGDPFHILLAFACLFPAMFVFAISRKHRDGTTISFAITVFGVAWMGIAFSHAVLLRDLELHGAALLIDVLVATFLADTAAYAGGRLFGTRSITPRISPNKTLEGLIAGFIGGTMGFWFAGLYQDWLPGIDALVMGMAIAAIAPIGDLFASLIKRDLEIKDTGTLFGPHGGLIDRLDAVLFTVVAGYYLAVAFVY